ncbi:MAG: HK97 gp10 family phage protein [Arcobacter sp.]|nr:HK97 gp10 family phage protein [Arcobacter sp.]
MATYEVDGLDALEKTLAQMINISYPKEFEQVVIQIAYEMQGRCKELTPVKTSRLQDAWRVGKIKRGSDGLYIEVYNNVEYAEPVNYGHRTGKSGYKEGVYMLEISIQEIQANLTPFLKSWIDNFIKEHGL